MNVCVGGTFDKLHEGHKYLLDVACAFSETLFVGLTSDEFARRTKKREIRPYSVRKHELEKYLEGKPVEIIEIDDMYGFAADMKDLDAIVVSTETYAKACKINKKREEKGLKPLLIIVIPLIKDEKGNKISSRGVR
ncbi:MAG: pantetheine-phosphate adenylyltransferase [Candidatus Diapherotrites archaeon]|nr:pantetheine-phosphate adenylyltransferase [Candidatus Diapherotrites archaeon]